MVPGARLGPIFTPPASRATPPSIRLRLASEFASLGFSAGVGGERHAKTVPLRPRFALEDRGQSLLRNVLELARGCERRGAFLKVVQEQQLELVSHSSSGRAGFVRVQSETEQRSSHRWAAPRAG